MRPPGPDGPPRPILDEDDPRGARPGGAGSVRPGRATCRAGLWEGTAMNRRIPRSIAVAAGVLLAAVAGVAPAGAHGRGHPRGPDADPVVIATGLDNPRQLSVGPGGALYVAESGVGGDGPCITTSEGVFACYGPTGAITRITHHRGDWSQRRVVTGLPSLAPPANLPPAQPGQAPVVKGGSATGPSDVAVFGSHYVASIGLGAPPAALAEGAATSQDGDTAQTLPEGFASLVEGRLSHSCSRDGRHGGHGRHAGRGHQGGHGRHGGDPRECGQWRTVADLAGFEAEHNPVDGPDSNPASVERVRGGYVVADAGGNTVVDVGRRGRTSLVASFDDVMVEFPPNSGNEMPMQFVPTSAVPGPRGSYFVSQLTGFPFPEGGSTIWQVFPARGHRDARAVPYATGLTNVTDLALAPGGDLYAVQISSTGLASPAGPTNGALVRISHRRGHEVTTVAGGLFAPYGVALHGRSAYVTTGSILPGGGEVVRVPLGR
ncbi:ScyD/ScyE family protein [Pseudactinotalea sp. HY160]|nr:ScyD/ScyE family protein [Pseudactinotalea sp. HY160]